MDKSTSFFLLTGVFSLVASRVVPRTRDPENFVDAQWGGVRELSLVVAGVCLPIAAVLIIGHLV